MPVPPDLSQASAAHLPVTGLILAGGRARRMGGQDKGLIPFAGRPLIEHALDRLRPQVDRVLISANRNADQYARYGARVIADAIGDFAGPLAGILSAMQVMEQPWLAVIPCDAPLLPDDLVHRLLASANAASAPIAVAHDGQRPQFVVALLHCSLLPQLRNYLESGEHRVETWCRQNSMAVSDFSDRPEAFHNINSPEDLAALEQQLRARGPGSPPR